MVYILLAVVAAVAAWTAHSQSKILEKQEGINKKFEKISSDLSDAREEIKKEAKKNNNEEIEQLKVEIDKLDRKISEVGRYLENLDRTNKSIQIKIEECIQEIDSLEEDYKRNIFETNGRINKVNGDTIAKISKLDEKLNHIEEKIKEKTPIVIEQFLDVELINKTAPAKAKVLFEDIKNYEGQYKKLLEGIEKIKKYIEKSSYEEGKIFYKMASQYQEEIKKIYEKTDLKKVDKEEFSENATYKYMGAIEKNLIKILHSAERGRKIKKESFYEEIGKKVKEYLAEMGIVPKDTGCREGQKMTENSYNYMEIIKATAPESSLNGIVKEVELAPYSVNYLDEDGEEKEYVTRGKISVYLA